MANVVFHCPVQVFKYEDGAQKQVAPQAMLALLRNAKQYILQCYSQKEVYCAIALTKAYPLHVTLQAEGSYASFYDHTNTNWSLRFRNAAECATLAANACVTCHLLAHGGVAGAPATVPLNTPAGGEQVTANDIASVRLYKWRLDVADDVATLSGAQQQDAAIAVRAGHADVPRGALEVAVGQITCVIAPGSCVVVEVTARQAQPQPQPVVAPPAPVAAPAAPAAPVAAAAPAAPASIGADAMVQALLMSQLQQQPLQFAALHKKIEQVGEKFDKFDLNAQFGAFQKIITEFNEHNRTFWEKHNRREKEFMELETALCKERGEHQVLRQEHTIAQRELRIQTEMKVQNAAKKNKWKQKCRQLEQDRKQAGSELEAAKNSEIEELKKQLQDERAARREQAAEHAQELKYAEEDALQKAKAQLISVAPATFAAGADASSSIEALMEARQKLSKLEEELQLARKGHMEEVVGLQDKLVQEKEANKDLQKKCTNHAKRIDELMGELREREMELDRMKEDHTKEIQQLKERLYQIGEGQLSMQYELCKQELKQKQKENEELREQLDEKKSREQGAMDAVSRQRDRISDELREYQRAQLQHDEELNKIRLQLMKEKETNMALSDRFSKAQTELQVLLREKADREVLEGSGDSKPAVAPEEMGSQIKTIMSDVYYDISEQLNEEDTYTGETVLALLLKAIKEQTLKAIS